MRRRLPLLAVLALAAAACDPHPGRAPAGPARPSGSPVGSGGNGGPATGGNVSLPPTPPSGRRWIVRGRVLDYARNPVPGARVKVQGKPFTALADSSGRFQIAVDPAMSFPAVLGAAREGYYNGGTDVFDLNDGWTIYLKKLPPADPTRKSFQPSSVCAKCHSAHVAEWKTADHSEAGEDLWVHDLLDGLGTPSGWQGFVYERDSRHRSALPHGDCSNCHTPLRARGRFGAAMGNPQQPDPKMQEGVSCDVCHKVRRVDLRFADYPGIHPKAAQFHQPKDDQLDPVVLGTLTDVTFRVKPMWPSYSPALADGHSVCALCHEHNIDHDGDGDYTDPGSLPDQETWSEWRASPYAQPGPGYKTCVSCHMPLTTRTTIADIQAVGGRKVRSHAFPGHGFGLRASSSDLRLSARRLAAGAIEVLVEVENKGAGHSLPTGIFLRNILLLVEATAAGKRVPLLQGSRLDKLAGAAGTPAAGYFAGLPGKVYAKVFEDASGNWPVFPTEALRIRYDTRLPAGRIDRLRFVFANLTGPVTVRARLIYRKAYRAFVDAKRWTKSGHGGPLADLQAPHFGALMQDRSVTVN